MEMDNEKEMFWAEASADELGELIKFVSGDHLGLSTEELAGAINNKQGTIEGAIEGKNAHGFTILKKTCERFKLKLDILISEKTE